MSAQPTSRSSRDSTASRSLVALPQPNESKGVNEPVRLHIPESLEEAVYRAVLYADIFDYPLTRDEVRTFLEAPDAPSGSVELSINRALRGEWGLETDGDYLFLRERHEILDTRKKRSASAHVLWNRAYQYGQWIWGLPFVRMVAVTGSLAADNVDGNGDIDFLIVTEPGRLWMARAATILVCKLARRRGQVLCPNYILTTRALRLDQQDLYTAHELAQMVPLHGKEVADRMWSENVWCLDVLPNVEWESLNTAQDSLPWLLAIFKGAAETLLRLPLLGGIERWERSRKIPKLSAQMSDGSGEVLFTQDVCKGHGQGHGRRITALFAQRLQQLR